MSLTLEAQTLPLRRDEHGTIRVGETRVTLDSVVAAFRQGSSPEQIAHSFDAVELADIYQVVSYYLRNRAEVDAYLAKQAEIAEGHRQYFESRFDPNGTRDRLLERKRAMEAEQTRRSTT